jgi:hypothetical protein
MDSGGSNPPLARRGEVAQLAEAPLVAATQSQSLAPDLVFAAERQIEYANTGVAGCKFESCLLRHMER